MNAKRLCGAGSRRHDEANVNASGAPSQVGLFIGALEDANEPQLDQCDPVL